MTDIKHDFDAAEALARNFDSHSARLSEHHARTGRSRARAVSGRGGHPLARAVSEAADRALEAIEKALDGLAKHGTDAAGGIRTMSKNHAEMEKKLADRYKRIVEGHDTTPVYLLDRKGALHRVGHDGNLHAVGDDDTSGVRHFFGGNTPRPPAVMKKVPDDKAGDKVTSRKIRPGSTELARATERARLAARDDPEDGDYGSPQSKIKANYAALHYQDDNRNFIVVASSLWPDLHSEKRLGVPILDKGLGQHAQAVYTERAPCDERSNSNCSAWLKWKFPGLTDVSHGIDYPGNDEHKTYLETLRRRHGQIHGGH
ncbi:nucleic acid/nucleotide deaminase domain-containing protein [Kitasatospora sp. NPDC048365]|uniref:nucleic acid/nucleotide deaminase domain-containing protein n=1 Tax=Kitasatospora sp. NPDC048365 TaxID=3364050 RepID=UPI00371D90E2